MKGNHWTVFAVNLVHRILIEKWFEPEDMDGGVSNGLEFLDILCELRITMVKVLLEMLTVINECE